MGVSGELMGGGNRLWELRLNESTLALNIKSQQGCCKKAGFFFLLLYDLGFH